MKLDKSQLELYAIADGVGGVEEAISGGATVVQFRDKASDSAVFRRTAAAVLDVCRTYGVPCIVNDNVEIAVEIAADGVHVGQHDTDVAVARKIIGEDKILGVSVQTTEQAIRAERCGADYLGVGAVFATSSKSDADSVSLATLTDICNAVTIPVVAIGGIGEGNVHLLADTGICGVAVISAIFGSPDAESAARRLRRLTTNLFGKEQQI